jgi:hypothetical protein
MKFTREQWTAILEAERARGDEARASLISFIEKKLSVNQHPAIQAYREETHYYPPSEWSPRIIEKVGDRPERVKFWQNVVARYVGTYRNPKNIVGMLEFFERNELPGTKPGNASARPPVAVAVAAGEYIDPSEFFKAT